MTAVQRKRWWKALALAALLVACDQGQGPCAAVACAGYGVDLPLVDEAGQGVAVKGEYRSNQDGGSARGFNCTSTANPKPYPDCDANRLQVQSPLQANSSFEIRFQDSSGS